MILFPELPEIFQKLVVHAKVFKEHHTVSLFSREQKLAHGPTVLLSVFSK